MPLALIAALFRASAAPIRMEDASTQLLPSDEPAIVVASLPFGGDGLQGAAWLDFDGDADLNLFLPNGPSAPSFLLRNNGDGTFVDFALASGAKVQSGSAGVLAAALDGDGATDLLLLGDGAGNQGASSPAVLLHNQGDGTFADATAASGIAALLPPTHLFATAGDADGDGDLDVFVGAPGALGADRQDTNVLLRNEGGLSFVEVGAAAGVAGGWGACAASFTHLDDDAWIDLLVANCNDVFGATTPFEVYLNRGDGTFDEASTDRKVWGLGYWMGLALADFDNDGGWDFYSTNTGRDGFTHALYLHQADGSWSDVGIAAGVGDWEFAWGTVAADFDNDGLVDLYFAGAPREMVEPRSGESYPGRLFRNLGGGAFEAPVEPVNTSRLFTSGVAAADYDRDGFTDLLVVATARADIETPGTPTLMRNLGNEGGSITVRLVDDAPNPAAVGARILALTPDGAVQTRQVLAGSSFLSTDSPWPGFGLGEAETVELCVRWPDGTGEDFGAFTPRQEIELVRSAGRGTVPCTFASVHDGVPAPLLDEAGCGGCAVPVGPGRAIGWGGWGIGLALCRRRRERPSAPR